MHPCYKLTTYFLLHQEEEEDEDDSFVPLTDDMERKVMLPPSIASHQNSDSKLTDRDGKPGLFG